MRWTQEDVLAHLDRISAGATVRTHKIKDDTETHAHRKGRCAPVVTGFKVEERLVLRACLNALEMHPKVSFAWRQNVGAMRQDHRVVKFSFRGCSDILGCLKDGRFLAVECKATGETPSQYQWAFLRRVKAAGGVAIWTDDAGKMVKELESA